MRLNFSVKSNFIIKVVPYVIWKAAIVAVCYNWHLSHHVPFMAIVAILDIVFVSWIISKVIKENIISMHVSTSGKEAYLSNKNMALLTENIHHEVKTPLVVIQSKIEYLEDMYIKLKKSVYDPKKRAMDTVIMSCDPNVCDKVKSDPNVCKSCIAHGKTHIEETFDMVNLHINAIHNVLDRMQNFKQIKHSNGNKTLYDIVQASFTTLKLYSKQNFSCTIDPELKFYHVINLKNEDILNIFINHIKNSLEANATKIIVSSDYYDQKQKCLRLYMSDNGNGIPEDVIPHIFSPKFSTKSGDGEVRGIGLWLSKKILSDNGGGEYVQESSIDGTTFCFEIPTEGVPK